MTNYEMIQSLSKENLAVLLKSINGAFSFSEEYCEHCKHRIDSHGCDIDPLPCLNVTPLDDVMAWLDFEVGEEK